jgi:hypothetical protein
LLELRPCGLTKLHRSETNSIQAVKSEIYFRTDFSTVFSDESIHIFCKTNKIKSEINLYHESKAAISKATLISCNEVASTRLEYTLELMTGIENWLRKIQIDHHISEVVCSLDSPHLVIQLKLRLWDCCPKKHRWHCSI